MRKLFATAVVLGLLAALLAVPGTALAKAEFTEYTGTETRIPDSFTVLSIHGTDVVQMRFTSEWNDVTTDARATGRTVVTGHLTLTDPATGTGVMRGTAVTYVTGQYEGTWESTWQGRLIYGVGFFEAVGHGTGDLAGLKMKATFTGVDPDNVNIEGRILDPHGG